MVVGSREKVQGPAAPFCLLASSGSRLARGGCCRPCPLIRMPFGRREGEPRPRDRRGGPLLGDGQALRVHVLCLTHRACPVWPAAAHPPTRWAWCVRPAGVVAGTRGGDGDSGLRRRGDSAGGGGGDGISARWGGAAIRPLACVVGGGSSSWPTGKTWLLRVASLRWPPVSPPLRLPPSAVLLGRVHR